jgi:hypothetical protein
MVLRLPLKAANPLRLKEFCSDWETFLMQEVHSDIRVKQSPFSHANRTQSLGGGDDIVRLEDVPEILGSGLNLLQAPALPLSRV